MIVIVDAGMGNVGSVANMLLHIGAVARIAQTPAGLDGAERVILPGVGAFDHGMDRLERTGFRTALDHMVSHGMPVLGICLGFQLMGRSSAEGSRQGLGWLDAETRSFDADVLAGHGLRIPHLGWSDVTVLRPDPLFVESGQRFYFVHGFHVVCGGSTEVVAQAEHGLHFTAAARRDHIVGVQFHPEKSHRHGMALLRGFAGLPR